MQPRCDRWEMHLSHVIAEWQRINFKWGEADCVRFCQVAMRAMGLDDVAARLEPGCFYSSEIEANRCLIKGGKDFKAAVSARLGLLPMRGIPPRGAIVMHKTGSLGIMDVSKAWFMSPNGLMAHPIGSLSCWWDV